MKIFDQLNLTVSKGDPASFTCSVRCIAPGFACIGLSAGWTRRGDGGNSSTEQLPDGAVISTRHTNITLSFSSATVEGSGAYVCTGMTLNFSTSDVAYLTVKGNYDLHIYAYFL